MNTAEHAFAVLASVAGIPTAPLHEEGVARHMAGALQQYGFSVRQDGFGNLTATLRRGREARPLALVAHMDHPGFVVTRSMGREVLADVLGGFQPTVLDIGTPVRFYDGDISCAGAIREYLPAVGRLRPAVRVSIEGSIGAGAFATLDLPACLRLNGLLALRAADDLAQCACLLLVAERLASVAEPVDVTIVLTRAEEIGLVGATLVAEAGLVARESTVVSLECSVALPGAEMGKGPVIRVGDAGQTFDPRGEALLLTARDQLLQQWSRAPETAGRAIQRQLMSGGRCEATAFMAHGYITTGVVLPLGNYHNADAHGHMAPEHIHMDDLLSAAELLLAAAESCHPLPDRHGRLASLAQQEASRLRETAASWRLGLPPALNGGN